MVQPQFLQLGPISSAAYFLEIILHIIQDGCIYIHIHLAALIG